MMYHVYVRMLDHERPWVTSDRGLWWRGLIHLLSGPRVPCDDSIVILRVCWRVLLMMAGSTWIMI